MRMVALIVLLTATRVALADKPADHARKIVSAQLEALRASDSDALKLTFAPDAVIIGLASDKPASALVASEIVFDRMVNGPGDITKARTASIVAGGDAKTLWWTAEVVLSGTFREAGTTTPTWTQKYRLSELATHDGAAWKVVAAVFDTGTKNLPEVTAEDTPDAFAGATDAGPLTAMLAAPATIATSITTDASAFVIGTAPGERGIGKAAKKTIGGWKKLSLSISGTPREVRTATHGFAQATVDWKKGKTTYRMVGVIFAVPRRDGSWQPVGVHYH